VRTFEFRSQWHEVLSDRIHNSWESGGPGVPCPAGFGSFCIGKGFWKKSQNGFREREREPTLVDYVLISAIIGWICCSPSLRFGWIRWQILQVWKCVTWLRNAECMDLSCKIFINTSVFDIHGTKYHTLLPSTGKIVVSGGFVAQHLPWGCGKKPAPCIYSSSNNPTRLYLECLTST
jgi:hypothetical protein